MPIELDGPGTGSGAPVLKRGVIGETFVGAVVNMEQRDMLKEDRPVLKENGKPRQELVVHLLTMGTDMRAGLGDISAVPAPGEVVRLILKGGGFGQWIEAKAEISRSLGRGIQVGDVCYVDTTNAVRYQSTGAHSELGNITTQVELDQYYATSEAYRGRQESLGFRGQLKLRPAKPEEAGVVVDAEAAYASLKAGPPIELEQAPPPAPAPQAAAPAPQPAPAAPPAPAPAPAPAAAAPAGGLADLF